MDGVQLVMNIALSLITLAAIPIILPPLLFYRVVSFILRSIFTENLAGKVAVITGASSGIGEHLAYEYARRGACLVLAARRADRLEAVALRARQLGSPEVVVEVVDVSKVEDSKRCVEAAVNHFGRLDHLVNNAGIAPIGHFEDFTNVENLAPVMNVNFWGPVYFTHFAIPHLRKSKGKIIVNTSIAGWFPTPKLSVYSASKAALIRFYESLRIEVGSDIGVTIVTPGVVDSEITRDAKFRSKVKLESYPVESTESCAKAIMKSVCRGDKFLVVPSWYSMLFLWELLCQEIVQTCLGLVCSRNKTD